MASKLAMDGKPEEQARASSQKIKKERQPPVQNTPGLTPPTKTHPPKKALIIGAGLAGCATANQLTKKGTHCTLYDTTPKIASSTSAIPTATIHPSQSGDKTHTDYFTKAFEVCCQQLPPNLFTQCGALQLTPPSSPPPPKNATKITAQEASTLADTRIDTEAWHFETAGYTNPQAMCNHLAQHDNIEFCGNTTITELRPTQFGWQLLSDEEVINESELVIIANSHAAMQFSVSSHLPLQAIKGQIDLFDTAGSNVKKIIHGNGYLVPASAGIWSGATHHRNQKQCVTTTADTRKNRMNALALAPALTLNEQALASFAGVRASTPDRLPVIGALPDEVWYRENYHDLRHGKPANRFLPPVYHQGLYVIAGFGGRGATQALFSAQLLAALIHGDGQEEWLKALHPARFLLRKLRKGL